MKLLVVWLAVAAALLPADSGAVQADEPGQLQTTIQENTAKLAALREQISSNQAQMAHLDEQVSDVRRSHTEIAQEIADSRQLMSDMVSSEHALTGQSEALAQEVAERQARYVTQKRALAVSLRNMYLRGQRGELEMVLTADSFSDLLTHMKVSRMLARLEAGVVEKTRQEGARIANEQHLVASAMAEITRSQAEKRAENDRLEELMAEQTAALRHLEKEKTGVRNHMLELSLNEQKLNYVLEDLEQLRRAQVAQADTMATTSLARLAGRLEWPVQGKLIRGFGRSVHPRFKTVTLNNGVNIAARVGSAVAAVATGSVQFADHLPGFGQCVILDHGGGYYTLYANLGFVVVDKGEQIARGQVIAEVGEPEGGGRPQLYFEIRQGRTPLDPGDWLEAR